MTTQIAWNDGTGDMIYLSYEATEKDQTIMVSSDAHTGHVPRSKDITFTVTAGSTTITRTLTVIQNGKEITIITRNGVAMTDNEVAVGYEQR